MNSYPQNCLSLDIYTSNVVYEELQPVVVFIGGSDLKEDDEVRPTSSAAKKHKVVFVDVSYRLGALGFLSLKSLALRSYPNYSGNYGLGDVITALEWIQLNIQHFGGHPHKVHNCQQINNMLDHEQCFLLKGDTTRERLWRRRRLGSHHGAQSKGSLPSGLGHQRCRCIR